MRQDHPSDDGPLGTIDQRPIEITETIDRMEEKLDETMANTKTPVGALLLGLLLLILYSVERDLGWIPLWK